MKLNEKEQKNRSNSKNLNLQKSFSQLAKAQKYAIKYLHPETYGKPTGFRGHVTIDFLVDSINGLLRVRSEGERTFHPSWTLQEKYIDVLCSLAYDLLQERTKGA